MSYPLPELNKKIIYIDQFAISNMMKAINPKTKAYKKGTLDGFWVRLLERLHSLCKLQLAICPDSAFHREESLLSPYVKPLKRMYKSLSYGVSFDDHTRIERFQICEHAKNWISGKQKENLNLDVHSVVHGEINAWQERWILSVDSIIGEDGIENLRKDREKLFEALSKVFERWKDEEDKTFNDWFEEESMALGRGILQVHWIHLSRLAEISAGFAEMTANNLSPPVSTILIHSVRAVFKEAGIQDSDIFSKTSEYLNSSSLKDVPFNKIGALLVAALARKAGAGKKKLPNLGINNDIEMISTLLPYCDAMFIDNECHSYLREHPLCEEIDYGTKIFSQNTRGEFFDYLDEIESAAPREHLEKVIEVYGESWPGPYTTLYEGI